MRIMLIFDLFFKKNISEVDSVLSLYIREFTNSVTRTGEYCKKTILQVVVESWDALSLYFFPHQRAL